MAGSPRCAAPLVGIAGARLHGVDDDHTDDQCDDGHAHANQDLPASDGEAQHGDRDEKEAQHQVDGGEPAVLGRVVAQGLG